MEHLLDCCKERMIIHVNCLGLSSGNINHSINVSVMGPVADCSVLKENGRWEQNSVWAIFQVFLPARKRREIRLVEGDLE